MPDLTVWYGPDSYMGANLAEMFRQMLSFSDKEIAAIHPAHNRETIAALLPRLKYFQVYVFSYYHVPWTGASSSEIGSFTLQENSTNLVTLGCRMELV